MRRNAPHITRLPLGVTAAALLVMLWAGGCQRYHDYTAFVREPRPIVTTTDYRVAPPDVLSVTSRRVRELASHTEQIRPDGKLTLPLLGEVFVAGRSVEEIRVDLQQRATTFYEDADITVRVTSYNSQKVYVFGEVASPGTYPYNGANTVLGTLARAQPTRLADPARIHILRPNRDGRLIRRMTINLDKMVKEGDTKLDAVLEEGDIVFVPANALAAVGLALQQVLLPIQPAATTVSAPTGIDGDLRRQPYQAAD
jgi:polysaccharide export outer membrane protein